MLFIPYEKPISMLIITNILFDAQGRMALIRGKWVKA